MKKIKRVTAQPCEGLRQRLLLFLFLMILIPLNIGCTQKQQNVHLKLATTTSTYDSGLITQILPDFEAQTGISVGVIAVGTGEALALGRAADVDIVLVHARAQEDEFVADGYGFGRRDVMCNDFVLVGSETDPAAIDQETDVVEAFAKIAAAQTPFLSRGDKSGTHIREMEIWDAVGIDPMQSVNSDRWYQSIGQGMGALLTFANEQGAYTLADRGTFLKRQDLSLVVLVEGDTRLFNPYGVMQVHGRPKAETEAAARLINWLTSPATQSQINAYRVNGRPLFKTDC